MATSPRARLRAPENMRAVARVRKNPCAPENRLRARHPRRNESPPKRGWPAPVVYTEEALAEARRRYEHTDECLTSIAAGLGTSARTLQRIARSKAGCARAAAARRHPGGAAADGDAGAGGRCRAARA